MLAFGLWEEAGVHGEISGEDHADLTPQKPLSFYKVILPIPNSFGDPQCFVNIFYFTSISSVIYLGIFLEFHH